MGGFGWQNPWPFQWGGGPSDVEETYLALRKAVGEGGPGPEDGLEDMWRQVKSQAITAGESAMERAAMQVFPGFASDHLGLWESWLGVEPAETDEARRVAVARALARAIDADIPHLREALQAIDPNADVQPVAYAAATCVHFGKAFGPRSGGSAYGTGAASGVNASGWPNFATDFVLLVSYSLPSGETNIPADARRALARHLCEVLPAHVDFAIFSNTPFYLDGGPDGDSLLDATAFG